MNSSVTITTMNDSNRWHITENLLTTEERGKEKRDGARGGIYIPEVLTAISVQTASNVCFSLSFRVPVTAYRVPAISRDSLIWWRQDLSVAPAPPI